MNARNARNAGTPERRNGTPERRNAGTERRNGTPERRKPRSGRSIVAGLVFALAVSGCDKKPESAESTETTAPATAAQQAEPAKETASTNNAPTGKVSKFDTIADGEWCARAHSDTVKLVEAMKETMKRTGKEDDNQYDIPPADEYVALCNKLPPTMQKCLVLGYAVKKKDECQAAQDSLDGDAKAAYTELMGK